MCCRAVSFLATSRLSASYLTTMPCRSCLSLGQGLGDEYMLVLAKALVHLPAIRLLDVSDNRLTDVSLKQILMCVPATASSL